MSLRDGPVKCFKNDGHEIVTLGAFDLLEGLDIFMLRAVHDGKNLCDEAGLISRPVASRTGIKRFQSFAP